MSDRPGVRSGLTQLQMIVGAMISGVVMFGIVVVVVEGRMSDDAELARILVPVLGVLGLTECAGYALLRGVVLNRLRRQFAESPAQEDDAADRVLPAMSTLTLIRSAMAESFGLFGLVIVLVTGEQMVLVAPLLSVLILAVFFPTQQKLSQLAADISGENPYQVS